MENAKTHTALNHLLIVGVFDWGHAYKLVESTQILKMTNKHNRCLRFPLCQWKNKLLRTGYHPDTNSLLTLFGKLFAEHTVLPELGIITVDSDGLGYIKGVFKDKLHVLSRAQTGVEQVLGGDGLAQHVGDGLCLVVLFKRFDLLKFSGQPGFLSPILTPKKKTFTPGNTIS